MASTAARLLRPPFVAFVLSKLILPIYDKHRGSAERAQQGELEGRKAARALNEVGQVVIGVNALEPQRMAVLVVQSVFDRDGATVAGTLDFAHHVVIVIAVRVTEEINRAANL